METIVRMRSPWENEEYVQLFKKAEVNSDITALYGLGNADKIYNFQRLIDNMNILGEFVEYGMLPIAVNDFGDYITIGIRKKENGCIFFRYHDRGKKYIKLADTLCEFASKCKSEKIEYIPTVEERRQDLIERGYGANITEGLIKLWQAEIDEYAHIHQEEFVL